MKQRLLYAVSVLPALLVMPAVADEPVTTTIKTSHGAAVVWSGVENQELVGNGQTENVSYKKNDDGSITVEINGYNKGTFGAFSNYFGRDDRGDFDGDHVGIASFVMKDSTFTSVTGVDQDVVIEGTPVHVDSAGGAMSLWTDGRNPDESESTCPYGYGDLADTLWPDHKLPAQPPAGTIINTTFTGNNADKGGAVAFLSGMWFEMPADYTFTDVTFTGNGIQNYGTDDATVVAAQGGAIYLETSHLTINGKSSFTGNSATAKGGAIYVNSKGDEILTLNGTSFISNIAQRGGAIYNVGTVNVDKTEFKANYSDGFVKDDFGGGAIWNKGTANIQNSAFSQNYSVFDGGAINNVAGATLSLVNTNFTGNYKNDVETYWGGGAIANSGSITKIDGGTFLNNHADGTKSYGGAIYVRDSGVVSEITGTRFIGNYSLYHGGALATIENAEIKLIKNAYFEGNGVKDYDTEDAVAVTQYGGAFKHGGNHETEIQNSTFINNMATLRGGAIINETSALVKINNNSIFTSNKAEQHGGALHGNFEISDSKFSLNSAVMAGGAMSGYGKISNTMFKNNFAGQEAGALVVSSGEMELNNVTFDTNYVDDTYFANGVADWQRGGGAVYSQGTLTVTDSSFDGNYAGGMGGAISNWWGGDAKLTATNTDFKNNYSSYGYGGAIFNSEKIAKLTTDSGNVFSNNTAVAGGAIANMSRYSDAKGKSVTIDSIDGYTFENNHAIANDKALIRVAEGADAGKFENASDELRGHVNGMGGAIYNEKVITSMSNVTFTGNTATDFGGAIYNANGASITMSGTNQFSGNTAKGVANDIHNDGTLTIAGGETTLTGGMTGNGTFVLADGATLNLGTATMKQAVFNLNGTLNATINSATDYAQLFGDTTFSDTSVLNLTVGAVGTYKMFNSVTGDIAINAGSLFDAVSTDAGIVVTTKSAAEIAENTGLSEDAASMLSNVANANSDALAAVSIAAQQELMAGNTEYVAAEMEKLNPADKPVVQAVAASIQNEVLNLVSARMATVAGRAGGDLSLTGGGVWAQGLFNKSKYNGVFHGYTRGVSAGIDEVIERDYTVGLGYAYASTDVHENKGRSTDITSNTLFLYAQYKPTDWFINAAVHYTTAEYKESTTVIGYSKASTHDVDSFGGSITTGYGFASGATPEVGLRYLNITQDDYVDSFGTKVASDTVQLLTSVAGVKYVFDINVTNAFVLRPELRAAATYDIISDKGGATVVMPGAASYVVEADRLSRVGGEFGIGMSAIVAGLELSLNYDLDLHKDYTSQTGMVKFRYEF